jgi:hypothetical protein
MDPVTYGKMFGELEVAVKVGWFGTMSLADAN